MLTSATPGIVGFLGSVGGAAVNLSAELSLAYGIPNIAPISGSSQLRASPYSSFTIGLRASQVDEAIAMVEYLRANLSLELISLFYEPSFAEQSTLQAIKLACSQTGLEFLASVAPSKLE
jgi:ABC-type branched-subunit amino acid transport system substrate-binding protein